MKYFLHCYLGTVPFVYECLAPSAQSAIDYHRSVSSAPCFQIFDINGNEVVDWE